MKKILEDAENWEALKLDKEYLQEALGLITSIAKREPYILSSLLCFIGAIENGRTAALAEECTLYITAELKHRLDSEAAKEDEDMGLIN